MELPFLVVKWAHNSSLQPSGNAMEMECVIANSPRSCALFLGVGDGMCLTIDAGLHNMILADRTVVNVDVYKMNKMIRYLCDFEIVESVFRFSLTPRPESNSIPLLHFESLLTLYFNHNMTVKYLIY